MNKFFVNPQQVSEEKKEIIINGEDVKHITKVLRLSKGETIQISDGIAYEYKAEIIHMSKDEVMAKFYEKMPLYTEPTTKIVLYQGIPKGTKMELIIQKNTEMGIHKIIPVIMDRTIVQFKNQMDKQKKLERWEKIAQEAAKQSKRGIIPPIDLPMSYKDALIHSQQNDMNILAYEAENSESLRHIFQNPKNRQAQQIGIWVGPEGGFERDEIDQAIDKNIKTITLGPRILRTETAGLVVLSILMYELGNLGV